MSDTTRDDASTPQSAPQRAERPASRESTQTDERVDQLPPYMVILHNDDQNDMVHVVESLEEITPLARPRAVEVMLVAHNRGQAVVVMTHQELAELYQNRLLRRGLIVTIEPAAGEQ
ncbi:MAG: ATP-dependent Clp protease adaptor ClpS [Phycisphaerae bacterium]|nr:ATP-dependent Clp protease adaptor ClpS [Phycisphaerae bacterium]|tara:strand:+ start:555 stop:905 length:351 start_codon:yes stop_codon:yes gene_type:complete